MNKPTLLVLCVASSIGALSTMAADLKPWMLDKGEPIFLEDFSTPLNPDIWTTSKGTWSVDQGVLKGAELPDDHHAAVVRRTVPLRDVIIQFDFRFDGSPGFSLSLNDAGGHNSRVSISPSDFTMTRDLDKKDQTSYTGLLGECTYSFAPGSWHTMLVEYHGDEMLARVDDKAFTVGSDPAINQERSSIGFPVSGTSMAFDNVKVWNGTMQKDWPAKRSKLEQIQQARPPVARDSLASEWRYAELKARKKLMETDPAFVALVDARAAADTALVKAYPKAFRKGAAAAAEKKRLQKEDPEFKAMSATLAKARKAEQDHMFEKEPQLQVLNQKIIAARKK